MRRWALVRKVWGTREGYLSSRSDGAGMETDKGLWLTGQCVAFQPQTTISFSCLHPGFEVPCGFDCLRALLRSLTYVITGTDAAAASVSRTSRTSRTPTSTSFSAIECIT